MAPPPVLMVVLAPRCLDEVGLRDVFVLDQEVIHKLDFVDLQGARSCQGESYLGRSSLCSHPRLHT